LTYWRSRKRKPEAVTGAEAVIEGLWMRVLHNVQFARHTEVTRMGIPALPVATTESMTSARAQAAALGRPEFDAVYIAIRFRIRCGRKSKYAQMPLEAKCN
jgi:hypothetical protein